MNYEEAAEFTQRYLDDYAAGGEPLAPSLRKRLKITSGASSFICYLETSDPGEALGAKGGPIVMVKDNGEIWMMGSAPNFPKQLREYTKNHGYA